MYIYTNTYTHIRFVASLAALSEAQHQNTYLHMYMCVCMYVCICIYIYINMYINMHIHVLDEGGLRHPVSGTGWRSLIGCLKLQVIFRKRATNYRALWRKITCKDKASSESTPPCSIIWGAASTWATQTADCNILQHTPTHCSAPNNTGVSTAPDSLLATLQHAATRCNTLQHVATNCNTLHHIASHSNALQNTEQRTCPWRAW